MPVKVYRYLPFEMNVIAPLDTGVPSTNVTVHIGDNEFSGPDELKNSAMTVYEADDAIYSSSSCSSIKIHTIISGDMCLRSFAFKMVILSCFVIVYNQLQQACARLL